MTTAEVEVEGRRGLRSHFLLLLVGAGIPLIVLLLAIGFWTYERAEERFVARRVEALQARLGSLEQMVSGVETHVAVMRSYVETRLHGRASLPPYAGVLQWAGNGVDPGPSAGAVMSPPGRATPDGLREIAAVEPIFALARASHVAHPHLRWSYYFSASKSFLAMYPWASSAEMFGSATPEKSYDSFYDYDVYKLALPEIDPDRRSYWTPVYLDAGGAGLMISHASPIYDGDTFLGIVGTDVLLSHLSNHLADVPPASGNVVVVDQFDDVVAAAHGLSPTAKEPTKASALLGSVPTAPTGPRFLQVRNARVASIAVAGTPWRMVVTIPAGVFSAAVMAEMWPHAALLVAILMTFAGFAILFGRKFVQPAVALAEYGARTGIADADGAPPEVPHAWRGLRDGIRTSFEEQAALVRQMRAMIDGVPLRAVYVDSGFVYRDANREFLDFVGLSRAELMGRRVADVLGANVELQYVQLAPRIRSGETVRWEGWIDFQGHGHRYLQVSVLPYTAAGEPESGFLTFTRDLTELKNAETEAAAGVVALAASEALHRSIVLTALDGIVVIDEQGVTQEFNPAAEVIFGRRAEDVVGRPICELIIPPSMREAHRDGMARYLSTGVARVVGRRIEVTGIDAEGRELPVELTITDVSQGGRRLFTSHIRDLRESKRLAREIEEGRDRLHQMEKLSAMGSLLASVAHELNNPLAIVIAQATLLVDKAKDEDTRRRADRIRAAADRCGRIVKSFLAMARQKPPRRETLDVAEIVRSALEMIGYGLRSAGIDVETRFEAGLPSIVADHDLMSQVVSNLILNAQQALSEQPPPRRLAIEGHHDGDRVALIFTDNGPGVPPEIAARVFDPYFTTKAAGVGTGIGLSISRNIIDAHGGELLLRNRPEGGAVFEIRLPVAPRLEVGLAVGDTAAAVRVLDVLVVDDEPDVGESLAEIIETLGHRTRVVDGAVAALALLGDGAAFDVIFTDLRMPGIDGVDLVDRIAVLRPASASRVIIVTGDSVAGPMRLARLGRDDLVTLEKPFAPDDVRTVIDRVMGLG